jgi:hypothetical protein
MVVTGRMRLERWVTVHFSAFLLAGMPHNFTVMSQLPEASSMPSGLYVTEFTLSVFRLTVVSHCPSSRSTA